MQTSICTLDKKGKKGIYIKYKKQGEIHEKPESVGGVTHTHTGKI